MKAFEVLINGHHHSTIGLREGVLSAIVNWGSRRPDEEFDLNLGALNTSTNEFIEWEAPAIGIGTEITIRIVDVPAVDAPTYRRSTAEIENPGCEE